MRKISLVTGLVAMVFLAACGGEKKTAINGDLKKDLDLASSSDGLTVGVGTDQSTQVVSAIERTAPAPRAAAASSKAPRHKPAPKSPPAVVVAEAPAVVAEPEPVNVEPQPVAVDPAPPVSPRPQPQIATNPGGNTGSVSTGSSTGSVFGSILGAVIRGAVVVGMGDGDSCDPRTDGRRRRGGMVNQRIPRIGTIPMTFPGRH